MPTNSATVKLSVNSSHATGVKNATDSPKCSIAPPTTCGSPICLSLSFSPMVNSSINTPMLARYSKIGPVSAGMPKRGPRADRVRMDA